MNLALKYPRVFEFDKRFFFVILCLLYAVNTFIFNELLITKQVYYQTFGEQIALQRIDEVFEFREHWKWIGYAIIPLMLLIKISFTAVCLNIGTMFAGYEISFKKLFQIALIAETIFLIGALSKSLWLLLFREVHVLQDVQYFYPMSLLTFVNDSASIERYLVYPLQTINLYEAAYWFALALGLHWALGKSFRSAFTLTAVSYGTGLLIWMIFIVFLSINIS